jgi:hypothetical protein
MGIATFPAPAGGGIKSVQRGSAGASGNVTITSVDIAKSFVTVFGSASSGTVSASFGMSQAAGNTVMQGATVQVAGGNLFMPPSATAATATDTGVTTAAGRSWTKTEAVNNGAITVNAGSNNLVSAVVTGFLAGATTLTVSGACRYEVVEFA